MGDVGDVLAASHDDRAPVVAGGNVYVFTRQKEHEVVQCIELATGKEVWRSEPYPAPCKAGPAAPGDIKPRATPAVAGGELLCAFPAATIERCVDALLGNPATRTADLGGKLGTRAFAGALCAEIGRRLR